MTHVEIIVAPDDPDDDDPRDDMGLTQDAASRLRDVLSAAGFRLVSGPYARPPLGHTTHTTRWRGHDVKGMGDGVANPGIPSTSEMDWRESR